jgi:hypothetical protein
MVFKINKQILSKKVISLFFIELASSILWLANVFYPNFEVIAMTMVFIFLSVMFTITLQLKITRIVPVLVASLIISIFVIRDRSYFTSLVAFQIFFRLGPYLDFVNKDSLALAGVTYKAVSAVRLYRQLNCQQLWRSELSLLMWQHAGVYSTDLGAEDDCFCGH